MSRKYRGSKDTNHDTLADAFRTMGCTVTDLHDTGVPGWPDLAVGCAGRTYLVEVKNLDTRYGRAGLTREQSAFARDWRGDEVVTATTSDDVIAMVNRWRRRKP